MQSSAMVALRTMMMIVCLVAVPLAAVCGTALPKVVRSAFGAREAWKPPAAAEGEPPGRTSSPELAADVLPTGARDDAAGAAASEAPIPPPPPLPRAKITAVRVVADAPPAVAVAAAAADTSAEPVLETAPLWNPSPRTASTPRGPKMTTTHFVPPVSPRHEAAAPRRARRSRPEVPMIGQHGVDRNGESLQKTVYSRHQESLPPADGDGLAPVERVNNSGALADSERRLRELGATYYRVETWGSEGKFYRCACNVPFNPHGRATRHFEATQSSPLAAIDSVIEQVEVWREKTAPLSKR